MSISDRENTPNGPAATIPAEKPHLFITGGAGYLGRNLVSHFVGLGHPVTALVRTETSAERVRERGARAVFGDVTKGDLAVAMTGCRFIIHAAADTDHGHGGQAQQRVNVDGTRRLLNAAQAAGIGKVIHISTESVLLDGRALNNVSEKHPYPARPAGSYSRTKAEAERIALATNGPDLQVVVLRPRFVWGRDDTTALPTLADAVRWGRFAWVEGGRYLTSTTHIGNLCQAVERALESGRGGEVYFVSDGPPVEFRSFVTALLATQGLVAPDKSVPRWLVRMIAGLGDVVAAISGGRLKAPLSRQTFATSAVEVTLDITKARDELGYDPAISRDAGLAEMYLSQIESLPTGENRTQKP